MIHLALGRGAIRIQRVRVIAQPAETHAVFGAKGVHVVGSGPGETAHVQVRDPGELALGLADRPAHDLDTVEALAGGEFQNLVQAEFREDGGDESEFHVSGEIKYCVLMSTENGVTCVRLKLQPQVIADLLTASTMRQRNRTSGDREQNRPAHLPKHTQHLGV